MKTRFSYAAKVQKAVTGEDGLPHLFFLVSGLKKDLQNQKASKVCLDKLAGFAKEGKLRLVPSHDSPIMLAKSVGAEILEDGSVVAEFVVQKDNILGMQVAKEFETGEWAERQVSVGGPWGVRKVAIDPETHTPFEEFMDWDLDHVALTFPGFAAYQDTQFMGSARKAIEAKDAKLLASRGWSEGSIAKAFEGTVTIPTFAERYGAPMPWEVLPGMMWCLQCTVEDIANIIKGPDQTAMLNQCLQEFGAAVTKYVFGAEADADAVGSPMMAQPPKAAVAKVGSPPAEPPAEGAPAPPPTPPPVPPVPPVVDVEAEVQKALSKIVGPAVDAAVAKATEGLKTRLVTTDPSTAPAKSTATQDGAVAKRREERMEEIKKALKSEPSAALRSDLEAEYNGLLFAR